MSVMQITWDPKQNLSLMLTGMDIRSLPLIFFFFFFFLYSHKSLQRQQLQYKSLGSMEMHNNPKTYT